MAIIARIVRFHAEEAAHLWRRREGAIEHAAFDRADLGRIDQRLKGHVAGLAAAGGEAWPIVLQQFEDYPEAGEAFVLMLTALVTDEGARVGTAKELVFAAPPEIQAGAGAATAWCGAAALRPHLDGWLYSGKAELNRLALHALLAHRTDPGPRLMDLHDHADSQVARLAAQVIGALGLGGAAAQLEGRAADSDTQVAMANAIALARLRAAPEDIARLDALGEARDWLLTQADQEEARAWLKDRAHGAEGVALLGVLGDPAMAEPILAAMEAPELAAAAGAAFRDLLPVDFDEVDVFCASAAQLGPSFEGRTDGPWPVAQKAREAWRLWRAGEIAGDFVSMRRIKLDALLAAAQDRGAVLGDWRAPVDFPAWS